MTPEIVVELYIMYCWRYFSEVFFLVLEVGDFNCSGGALIATREHLGLTGMTFIRTCVRTHVHTDVRVSRWKKLYSPYLIVVLSPRPGTWCMYVTSISDVQILIFPGINITAIFSDSKI